MYKTFKEVEEAVLARGRRVKLALAALLVNRLYPVIKIPKG